MVKSTINQSILYLVTCDSPSVVFDGLISLIKFKSKYNGMENIKKKTINQPVNQSVVLVFAVGLVALFLLF